MAYILIFLGAAGLYLDYLGFPNVAAAGALFRAEIFSYSPPFYKWLGAFIIVGMLGYIDQLKPIATAMLILIIVAIVLTNKRDAPGIVKSAVQAL